MKENEEIYLKLKELITCYKERISELKKEHQIIGLNSKYETNKESAIGLKIELGRIQEELGEV